MGTTSPYRIPCSNCGICVVICPNGLISAVTPLLVALIIQRPASRARIWAICKCCRGPIEVPNQVSLLMVSKISLCAASPATKSGYTTS